MLIINKFLVYGKPPIHSIYSQQYDLRSETQRRRVPYVALNIAGSLLNWEFVRMLRRNQRGRKATSLGQFANDKLVQSWKTQRATQRLHWDNNGHRERTYLGIQALCDI